MSGDNSLQWARIREVASKLGISSPDLRLHKLERCFELVFQRAASGREWDQFLQTYREARPGHEFRMISALSSDKKARFKSAQAAKMTLAYTTKNKLELLDVLVSWK